MTVRDNPGSAAEASTGDEWERMHIALTAWKARSYLTQAQAQLRRGEGNDNANPDLLARLYRADESVSAALASLQELDEFFTTSRR